MFFLDERFDNLRASDESLLVSLITIFENLD